MSTSDTPHYSDSHDISALLNQYIAEATEGEDTTADADFDFVDLDQLVQTAYEASDYAVSLQYFNSDVTTEFSSHGQDINDPLRLENENIEPTHVSLHNVENPAQISPFFEKKDSHNEMLKQDPIHCDNSKTGKEIKKRPKYEPYFSSVSKPNKRERPSRARAFRAEEICCFQCKTAFKKPQSLKAHLMHRHGTQNQFKITLRV